jgi:predicted O-linked N-acetylglucosamine transferase (SPINDLY family)
MNPGNDAPDAEKARSLISTGRAPEALALAREAVTLHPEDADWLHLLAVAQHATGANAEAAATLERAIAAAPRDAVIRNTYGAVQVGRGELASAEAALREALRLRPDYLEARFNLALALRDRRDAHAAAEELARILAVRPDFFPAQLEQAILQVEAGEARAALATLEALLQRFPADARILLVAASACRQLEDAASAAAYAARAALCAPASAEIRERAGDILAWAGRPADAREHFAFVATRAPRDARALEKLAAACHAAGDAAGAAQAFREHLALEPASRSTPQNLALALYALGEGAEAKRVLAKAIADGHDDAEMLDALASYKARECDWEGLDEIVVRLREKATRPGGRPAHPQTSLYFPQVTAVDQRRWAETWVAASMPAMAPVPDRIAREPRARLRIGFLSGDFHVHATAWLTAGMLEHHDRAPFEFVAYSHGPDDGSPLRTRLKQAFDRFEDVASLSSRGIAERIRADAVDVLLDLGGFVQSSRLDVLAFRPARIQCHYLGYPGTTGAPFVDFFIADAHTVPPGSEGAFSERILRMPHCYQPNDPLRARGAAPPREATGLSAKATVLCSFNQPIKITAPVFAQWCRLLRAMPDACLWLLAFDEEAQRNMQARARQEGIDPARLVFAPRIPQAEHLARMRHADLAIDTFPCGSHTTASDALWAGVPLVTTRGETFASRVASSLLATAGCPDWIFDNAREAFEATLALARSADALRVARRRVEHARSASPLFDDVAYARDFEALIEECSRT